jgi:tetratricopeptide (TPR) repeat protein
VLFGRASRRGEGRARIGQGTHQPPSPAAAIASSHTTTPPTVFNTLAQPMPASEPMTISNGKTLPPNRGQQSPPVASWTAMFRKSFFSINKPMEDSASPSAPPAAFGDAVPSPQTSHLHTLQEVLERVDIYSSESVVEAITTLEQLRSRTEVDAVWEVHARVLLNLSVLGLCSGRDENVSAAVAQLREVLHLYSSMGHHAHVIHVQCLLGSAYSQLGKDSYADHCFTVALKAVEALGATAVVEQAAPGTANTEALDAALPTIAYAKHLQRTKKYALALGQLLPQLELDRLHHTTSSRCELVLTAARCLTSLERRSEAVELLRSEIPSLTMAHLDNSDSSGQPPWQNHLRSRRPVPELLAVLYAELAGHASLRGESHRSVVRSTSKDGSPTSAPRDGDESAASLYEVAVELTLGSVRQTMQRFKKKGSDDAFQHSEVRAVIKLHAEMLFNAGECIGMNHRDQNSAAKAVGIIEESIKLMDRVGYECLTPRMRLRYVHALRQVGFVEEALRQLIRTLEIAGSSTPAPEVSSAAFHSTLDVALLGQHMGPTPRTVTVSEVHTHIAHCLHFSIGDFVRAHDHYVTALRTCHHSDVESMVESWESAHGGKQTERDPLHDCTAYEAVLRVEPLLRADTLSWLLESSADCMRRLQHPDHALELLHARVRIGRAVGDDCVSALVAISSVLEQLPERSVEACKAFDEMIALPQDAMTTLERLDLVIRYANFANYTLQDFAKATELYTLALELDDLNPMLLIQLGWCARQMSGDAQTTVAQLTAVYMKALSAMEIFKADAKLQQQRRPASTGNDSSVVHADAKINKNFWAPHFDEFFVLSEAARFFHEVLRDAPKAEALYLQAVEAAATAPPISVAHVLANFAILKYYVMNDREGADRLFVKALAINPANFVVSNLYSDFLIASAPSNADGANDSGAALQHIRQMIELFPDQSAVIYHKLARLEERNGNMGDEESRAGALVSYMVAASGDRDLDASALSDDRVLAIVSRCADVNLINNVIAFIQSRLKALPLAEQCSAAVYPRLRYHTTFLINYGRLCMDLGNVTQASQLFTEAYLLQPADSVVTEHYADFLASIDRNQALAGERLHLLCLQIHPHDAASHLAYAVYLTIHLPSPIIATKHFKIAIKLQPTDPNVWSQYAAFAERQAVAIGSTSKGYEDIMFEAEKAFNKARELSGDSSSSLLAAGLFYMRTKRSSEAWTCLKAAYEKAPNNHSIVSSCAIFLHDRHNNVASQKQALSSSNDPTDETKQLSELSDKLYRKAIKMDSNDAHVITQYAKFVEEVLLRPSEARQWLEHVDSINAKKKVTSDTAARKTRDDDDSEPKKE